MLFPKQYVDSVYNIDYKALKQNGISRLIFDIDNTLAPFDIPEPDEKLIKHFKALAIEGFKICLVSNNGENRVVLFNKPLGLPYIFRAGKPKKKGITKAMSLIEATPQNAALIGDQIFTDVWCGNRIGILTILVKPIADRDEFTVKLKRGVEKIVINLYLKYGKK